MKKCSLCGGKLNSEKRCTFCGLDNTKNDDMYKEMLNRNKCENEPLTHVHEEPARYTKKETVRRPVQKSEPVRTYPQTVKKKKKSGGCLKALIGMLPVLIAFIGIVGNIIGDIFDEIGVGYLEEDFFAEEEYNYDPYHWVIDEMPEDGEEYVYVLESGIYEVGYHIPMGIYEATLNAGTYGYIELYDSWNEIWLSESLDSDESNVVSDLRLFDGAYLMISSGVEVLMKSENAQPFIGEGIDNSLVQEVEVGEKLVAGEDFEAGIYDVVYTPGDDEYRYINLVLNLENYDYEYYVDLDTTMGEEVFRNLPIPEGTVIYLDDTETPDTVRLVPSEKVSGSDCNEFYEEYWY